MLKCFACPQCMSALITQFTPVRYDGLAGVEHQRLGEIADRGLSAMKHCTCSLGRAQC